jgi:Tfp pilus assembly protein FimV
MKKFMFIPISAVCALFVFSCVATPAPAPAPQQQPPPPQTREEPKPQAEIKSEPAEPQKQVDAASAPPQPGLIFDEAKTYIVVSGDTLFAIAEKNFGAGNAFYFPVIMQASQEEVGDPDRIRPGLRLLIPDLRKNLDNPGSRAKIKDLLDKTAALYSSRGNAEVAAELRDLAKSL